MHYARALCWFRRDLRLTDHSALAAAMKASAEVVGVFVFDTTILNTLPSNDRRVVFIWGCIQELYNAFKEQGGALYILHGDPIIELPKLAQQLNVDAVFVNRDVEPAAQQRDRSVEEALSGLEIAFHTFKDQMIFEKDEILTQASKPFSVFTPYKNAWMKHLQENDIQSKGSEERFAKLKTQCIAPQPPDLKTLGFEDSTQHRIKLEVGENGAASLFQDFLKRINRYDTQRNFPSIKGVSYLSVHLRFGTLSIREAVRAAYYRMLEGSTGAEIWLGELIWRDFYMAILAHHPYVTNESFKPMYRTLNFPNNKEWFEAWKTGKTGYPIVDAAMRQLNQTGYMHNRLRMIAASFLVKDLQIDWRWGERYFAEQLNDFDLAANNGGWQWCASTGCDAQPYFRIFNPITQSEKFDPDGTFIRKYIPELKNCSAKHIHAPWRFAGIELNGYPAPLVDHAVARLQTLERYKEAELMSSK